MPADDLRTALRSMRRAPLLFALAAASLALAIGANSAIFSLFDQALLRPIAVPAPGQLVMLDSTGPRRGQSFGPYTFSYPMYLQLRDRVPGLAGLAARHATPVTLALPGAEAQRVDAELVSGNFFQVLGVNALHGRTLQPADTLTPGAAPIAVLDGEFWRNRFSADPTVVGRTVRLNGFPFQIVGVANPAFRGVQAGYRPGFYLPVSMKTQATPSWDELNNSRAMWLQLMGRLSPGVSPDQAAAAAAPLFKNILAAELAEMPADYAPAGFGPRFLARRLLVHSAPGGIPLLRTESRTPIVVVMIMAALVLLIASANAANLLLARAASRRSEMALRLALGSSRAALVRIAVAESLLCSLAGAAAGLAAAGWFMDAFIALLPQDGLSLAFSPELDARVLAFSFALAVVCGVLAGLLPALHAARSASAPSLKESKSSESRSALRFKNALIVVQVALSVVLLSSSGLFLTSLRNLRRVDAGLNPAHLLSFSVDAPLAGVPAARVAGVYSQLQAAYAATPGVSASSLAENGLLSGGLWRMTIRVEGYRHTETENMNVEVNTVGDNFFSALGMPVLQGRELNSSDHASAPLAAVVNQAFADHFFANRNPVGGRITIPDRESVIIAGVVRDGKTVSLRDEPARRVYLPFRQTPNLGGVTFYVRTQSPAATLAALRRASSSLVSGLVLFDARSVHEQIEESLAGERLLAWLCSAFGTLATLLAALGLFGVLAWSVARRTREIGIRMALGARRSSVLAMVEGESARLALLGIAAGLPLALLLGRFVQSQLYGLSAHDPLTLALAALLILAVALLAALAPARRAATTDPLSALRYE